MHISLSRLWNADSIILYEIKIENIYTVESIYSEEEKNKYYIYINVVTHIHTSAHKHTHHTNAQDTRSLSRHWPTSSNKTTTQRDIYRERKRERGKPNEINLYEIDRFSMIEWPINLHLIAEHQNCQFRFLNHSLP